jgi:preprotein translocase subunit YajC
MDPNTMLMIGIFMAVIVFYSFGFNRKEKKQRQAMLENIKRNDRVMTVGGILGTVVGVKDNEVQLKIDESNNVKVTVVRTAIHKVLAEGEKPEIPQAR